MIMEKIVCVLGPTASGKSGLGIELAKELDGEVVSADSMQIYRGAHIASAAVSESEADGVPHHLLEFLESDSAFTVYDYLKKARKVIADIHKRGKLPIIVGGTGLYINALLDGIRLDSETGDKKVREELEKEYDEKGGEYLLERLKEFDKAAAEKLNPNDKKRIVRAHEIYRTSGISKTEQDKRSLLSGKDYDYTAIGITYFDRQKLYDRINMRVDIMLENGLLDEAKAAYKRRTDSTAGLNQAIGHKEFFPYFDGEISLDAAIENLKRSTRRYAKRQLTWFNKREDINWIYADREDTLSSARNILERQGYTFEKQ